MKVQISIKLLVKESFALFKDNILILLGLIFGGIVFSLLLSIPSTFQIGGMAGNIGSNLMRLLFQVFFSGMVIKYCLHAVKGYDPGFREILPSLAQCLKLFGFSILVSLLFIPYFIVADTITIAAMPKASVLVWIIGATSLYSLCIFYILTFKFWTVTYLILDKNYGIFEAIKKSWIITKGNQFSLFKLILIAILSIVAGIIALFIGVFIAFAFIMLLNTLYYTKIAAQLNESEQETDEF